MLFCVISHVIVHLRVGHELEITMVLACPVLKPHSSSGDASRMQGKQVSCILSTEGLTHRAEPENGHVVRQDGEVILVVNTTWAHNEEALPVAKGCLERKAVTVLNDTGCHTVIVRQI